MIIVVHDACALIDLLQADLIPAWVKCGVEIHTTELALLEVENDATPLHQSGRLVIKNHSADELKELRSFKTKVKKSLSVEDCSVLRLASELSAPLLTGDADLRSTAEQLGVRVHGMLWVLDVLVERGQFLKNDAARTLRDLIKCGSRFPSNEVEQRLRDWA